MISLGSILPLSYNLINNLQIFIIFLLLFFLCGSVYGIVASGYFAVKNFRKFKKEFIIRYKKLLRTNIVLSLLGILIMIGGLFSDILLLYLGIIVFILPIALYLYKIC